MVKAQVSKKAMILVSLTNLLKKYSCLITYLLIASIVMLCVCTCTTSSLDSAVMPPPAGGQMRLGRGMMMGVALSPNGDYLAVGTTVGLFVYRTENLVEMWGDVVDDTVGALDFSPDGNLLASGSRDVIVIWDVQTGERLRTLEPNRGPTTYVRFSPDGTMLASLSRDADETVVWDAQTGEVVRSIRSAGRLLWTSDSRVIVAGMRSWEIESGNMQSEWESPDAPYPYPTILSTTLGEDGQMLIAQSHFGRVYLWDSETGELLQTISFPEILDYSETTDFFDLMISMAWAPSGRILALGFSNGTLVLWDVERNEPLHVLLGDSSQAVSSLAWSSDGSTLVSRIGDTLALWNTETGASLGRLERGASNWTCLSWSPDGSKLAIGTYDGELIIWDTRAWHVSQELGPFGSIAHPVEYVVWSPNGAMIAAVSRLMFEGESIIWNLDADIPMYIPETTYGAITSVAWSPDRDTLVYGTANGTIMIWDAEMGQERQIIRSGDWIVSHVTWSPNGTALAASIRDEINLWNIETGELYLTLNGEDGVGDLEFSRDGAMLAAGLWNNQVVIWDVSSERPTYILEGHTEGLPHASGVTSVSWSPDSLRIASGGRDGKVMIWDITSGEQRLIFDGYPHVIRDVAWSPDGRTLASSSSDGTVVLWDVGG